jgi:hypothetical protein
MKAKALVRLPNYGRMKDKKFLRVRAAKSEWFGRISVYLP